MCVCIYSRAMQLNLLVKNKLSFFDGSIRREGFKDHMKNKKRGSMQPDDYFMDCEQC